MSVELKPSGRWRAKVTWRDATYHVGLFHTREAALYAVRQEYERLEAGTSWICGEGAARLTARDYAGRIRVPVGTVRRWIHEGMPVLRVNTSTVRIDPAEADAWVREHRPNSVSVDRKGTIYAVARQTDGAVKIGWTSNLERRLGELRKLERDAVVLVAAVPGDKPVELALHKELAAVRLDGEWFRTTPSYVLRRMASMALEAS